MEKRNAAWTVMVYLAGDNNLTTECMFALAEMKQAAFGKHLNVIAQFDPCDPHLPTHRYHIKRRGKKKSFRHDIIDRACYFSDSGEVSFVTESLRAQALAADRKRERDLCRPELYECNLTGSPAEEQVITDDTDTGSPVTLYNFITFCLEEYPADHYLVVLSGHAGGTERDYLLKDESSAGSLTFNELKNVFQRVKQDRNGKTIDIIGMDNCLMSMAEICYELRGLVDIVIGCESFSPASGWPYREVLERLATDFVSPRLRPGQSVAEAAAGAIVKEYVNYYANYWIAGLSVTQSALNVCKVETLREEIDKLAQLMEQQLAGEWQANGKARQFHDALLLAHWEAQSYNGEQFVDLYDFCHCLELRLEDGGVAEQCRAVQEFLRNEFVLTSCYCGAAYQYSYGVSLYFPWSHVAPSYWNLDFCKNANSGGWGSFLKTYTLLTRRLPRGINGDSRLAQALNSTIEDCLFSVLTSTDQADGERMGSDRMGTDRMGTDRMGTDRMGTDRMGTDRMGTDRMGTDRMGTDRMGSDRMNSGVAKNYIHSMRNPPDVFFPDECLRKRRSTLLTEEILRLQ
jgi:pentapeptide MXKDX repeat protein